MKNLKYREPKLWMLIAGILMIVLAIAVIALFYEVEDDAALMYRNSDYVVCEVAYE